MKTLQVLALTTAMAATPAVAQEIIVDNLDGTAEVIPIEVAHPDLPLAKNLKIEPSLGNPKYLNIAVDTADKRFVDVLETFQGNSNPEYVEELFDMAAGTDFYEGIRASFAYDSYGKFVSQSQFVGVFQSNQDIVGECSTTKFRDIAEEVWPQVETELASQNIDLTEIDGLVALLSTPVFAQDNQDTRLELTCSDYTPAFQLSEGRDGHYQCFPETPQKSLTIPTPESCNGWEGSQRQARFEYDGSASGYDFFDIHMDCLPEPAAWTFVDFYDPFTGAYGGSLGQNSDHVGMFLNTGSQTRVRMIVSSYDAYDPQTGVYGNLIGRDQILRFTSMDVPPLVDDTDGGDNPHIAGYIEVDDWTGHRFWPDYAIDEFNMVEMYRRGPAHLQDETSCEQVLVNGLPPVGYFDWPAECTNLFRDGFESGDLSAWSNHTE